MSVLVRAPQVGTAVRLPRTRGLIFDVAGVLHDATLWWRWLLGLVARLGVPGDPADLRTLWETAYLPDVERGRREHGEALEAFLAKVGLTRGQVDEAAFAAETRRREMLATLRPLPGVVGTIEQLQASHIPLAVLTNSEAPALGLEARLSRLELAGRFVGIVSSFDLERTLPDAECYQRALRTLGLPADEAAYVGCSRVCLAGAAAAGLSTIAVNHDRDAVADVRLRHFHELLAVVTP